MSDSNLAQENTENTPGLLLVDDEKNVLSSLKRLFRKAGCRLFIANSGQEGLEILAQQSIDVIISDARMPEMTGPEFLAVAADKYPNTIRILLTGYAEMEAIVDAVNLGKVSHYVEKPWDDEKLVELVEEAFSTIYLKKQNEHLQSLVESQNQKLTTLNETLEATVKERTQKIIEINRTLQENYKSTIDLFAHLLDMRISQFQADVADIATLVEDMAVTLAIPERDHLALTRAAKMRYISQMSFSDELLHTPYALLSTEQKHQYEEYPLTGATLLTSIRPLVPVADIILQHKEYLNGTGYPNGLKADAISLSAQILTVANDYLELVTGRLLEHPMSHQEALDYLAANKGTCYAKKVLAALNSALSTEALAAAIHDHCLPPKQLMTGMVLARDLKNHHGEFLLAKGTLLADSAIMILIELERSSKKAFQVYVDIPAGLEVPKKILSSIKAG